MCKIFFASLLTEISKIHETLYLNFFSCFSVSLQIWFCVVVTTVLQCFFDVYPDHHRSVIIADSIDNSESSLAVCCLFWNYDRHSFSLCNLFHCTPIYVYYK